MKSSVNSRRLIPTMLRGTPQSSSLQYYSCIKSALMLFIFSPPVSLSLCLAGFAALSPCFHPHSAVSHLGLGARWGSSIGGRCFLNVGLVCLSHYLLLHGPVDSSQSPERGVSSNSALHRWLATACLVMLLRGLVSDLPRAMVHTSPRSPTTGATAPRVSSLPPLLRASSRSCTPSSSLPPPSQVRSGPNGPRM